MTLRWSVLQTSEFSFLFFFFFFLIVVVVELLALACKLTDLGHSNMLLSIRLSCRTM